MRGDVECREFETRVCPRSVPGGCPGDVCYRFDTFPGPQDETVQRIWTEHMVITDQRLAAERAERKERSWVRRLLFRV